MLAHCGSPKYAEEQGLPHLATPFVFISLFYYFAFFPTTRFYQHCAVLDFKTIIILSIPKGIHTPYYYKADGICEAYIRLGDESIVAPNHILNELILDGMNKSFDSLISKYDKEDYAFSKLRERYKFWTGKSFDDKFLISFGLVDDDSKKLSNAGALIADQCPLRQSKLFCTRWNGLSKAGGLVDAIDSAEFTGSLIKLLEDGISFIQRNTKIVWKKLPTSRIEMPEYAERSCFEALVNGLVHRSYTEIGSEVHIDIFDDRMTIYSPGGMADGSTIQNQKLSEVSSKRRNPILADVFARIGYMERQGSGLEKIIEWYQTCANYTDDKIPKFSSTPSQFIVTLPNLNYTNKTGLLQEKQDFEVILNALTLSSPTQKNILCLYNQFGLSETFSRADIIKVCGITKSPASSLLNRMKDLKLIVSDDKKYGRYKFQDLKCK